MRDVPAVGPRHAAVGRRGPALGIDAGTAVVPRRHEDVAERGDRRLALRCGGRVAGAVVHDCVRRRRESGRAESPRQAVERNRFGPGKGLTRWRDAPRAQPRGLLRLRALALRLALCELGALRLLLALLAILESLVRDA